MKNKLLITSRLPPWLAESRYNLLSIEQTPLLVTLSAPLKLVFPAFVDGIEILQGEFLASGEAPTYYIEHDLNNGATTPTSVGDSRRWSKVDRDISQVETVPYISSNLQVEVVITNFTWMWSTYSVLLAASIEVAIFKTFHNHSMRMQKMKCLKTTN